MSKGDFPLLLFNLFETKRINQRKNNMKNKLREELEAMLGLHTGDSFTADNVHTLVNGILAVDEVGGFEYVGYDGTAFPSPTIGDTTEEVEGLGPATEEMIHTIFIMPNKEEDPDATMMIVVDEKDPGSGVYQYVYVGNINNLPSDVLTESSIINDLNTGGTNRPLSAEQGRTLNSHVNYTTCESGAADEVKLIPDSGFELSTHLRLLVKMNNTNTYATPKFNINNTGAKDVWYNGAVASDTNTWSAGEVLDVYYDGTNFQANNVAGGGNFATGQKVREIGIDDEPTANSNNLVKSGGVKAAIPEIIDNLDSLDTNKTLSANQGNKLTNILLKNTIKSDRISRTINSENSKILADGSIVEQALNQVATYNLTDIMKNSVGFEITGYKRTADLDSGLLYAFYNSNGVFISGGGQGKSGVITMKVFEIPLNAATLKVSWYYNGSSYNYPDYVYTFSRDSKFLSGQNISTVKINRLFEGGDDNVMSAESGKIIFDSLKNSVSITRSSNTPGSKILADGSIVEQALNQVATYNITDEIRNCIFLDITGYKRTADIDNCLLYAFYDSNGVFISGGGQGKSGVITMKVSEIPSNATILKVSWYYGNNTTYPAVVSITIIGNTNITTIHPEFERGRLGTDGLIATSAYIKNQRSCNYIKVHTNSIYIINMSINCILRIYEYADNYTLIKYTDISITANTNFEFQNTSCSFIKFQVSMTSDTDTTTLVPNFNFSVRGAFDSDWNVKNIRPSSGYQHLFVTVFPMDTRATAIYPLGIDAADISLESNNVQDSSELKYDSGLLALPESYTNNGKPTRLIIYCHGAGVNYSDSDPEFPSTDLRPEYWLSEGYAIMDMDGECGTSYGQQHNYAPESMQCYINAYKQVIRNYNIYTDGVFVGGRSMGGGMSISLCTTNEIPIISCCPVVPVLNNLWWWEYMGDSARRYVADKMGFSDIPSDWSSMNETNWNYLKSQFSYLVKYSPLWKCITDLPDADTLFDGLRMSASTHDINNSTVQAEYDVFKNLHANIKCPVKIFHNYTDPTVPWERNARIFYQMLINAGNNCELRMFHAENDVDTSITAHHFEFRTDRILPTYTNSFGVELENVPVVYIEMLKFWQRYEMHK